MSSDGIEMTEAQAIEIASRAWAEKQNYKLIHAARSDNQDLLEEALRNGADVNFMDPSKFTALMWACHHDHEKQVKRLLATPDINVQLTNADDRSAFSVAIEYRSDKALAVLLEKYPILIDTTIKRYGRECTPLLYLRLTLPASSHQLPAVDQTNPEKFVRTYELLTANGATSEELVLSEINEYINDTLRLRHGTPAAKTSLPAGAEKHDAATSLPAGAEKQEALAARYKLTLRI